MTVERAEYCMRTYQSRAALAAERARHGVVTPHAATAALIRQERLAYSRTARPHPRTTTSRPGRSTRWHAAKPRHHPCGIPSHHPGGEQPSHHPCGVYSVRATRGESQVWGTAESHLGLPALRVLRGFCLQGSDLLRKRLQAHKLANLSNDNGWLCGFKLL